MLSIGIDLNIFVAEKVDLIMEFLWIVLLIPTRLLELMELPFQ